MDRLRETTSIVPFEVRLYLKATQRAFFDKRNLRNEANFIEAKHIFYTFSYGYGNPIVLEEIRNILSNSYPGEERNTPKTLPAIK